MTKEVLEYIEKLEKDRELLLQALLIGAKYTRTNLPAELPYNDEHFHDYLNIIVNGSKRDPEGKEFANFWLYLAQQKIKN